MSEREKIVLCLPGLWSDRSEFIAAVAAGTEGQCIAAGPLIANPRANENVAFDFVEGPDPRMVEAFDDAAVYDPLTDLERAALAGHGSTVYLTSNQASVDDASRLARFAAILCERAGGLGVKVEAAGRAFSISSWLKRREDIDDRMIALYDSFVFPVVSEAPEAHYSCGMTQFGLSDTMVRGLTDLDEARNLIRFFDMYRLIETPELADGNTFSTDIDAPYWRMRQASHPYADDPYIDFSEGVWELTPLDGAQA